MTNTNDNHSNSTQPLCPCGCTFSEHRLIWAADPTKGEGRFIKFQCVHGLHDWEPS